MIIINVFNVQFSAKTVLVQVFVIFVKLLKRQTSILFRIVDVKTMLLFMEHFANVL